MTVMPEYDAATLQALAAKAISPPLVSHIYTADPSAHVFDGKIYIYPSHDIDGGVAPNDNGDHYCMRDYHVFRMDSPEGEAIDCGRVLDVDDVPWAAQQMWAPDAAQRNGRYYLYFPAKRADGIFQIGVAVAERPAGPFVAEAEPIRGSYSIDPAVLADDDGTCYMVFGGIWGGQLQKYRDNVYGATNAEPAADEPALGPRIARLADDMKQFAEAPREIVIVDAAGRPLRAGDHERRYFEGPWLHKYRGRWYLSYSTGNTHLLCYAIADDPYGPYTFQGQILTPVVGWTTHHSICEFGGRWWLFYHDAILSGASHLRSIKVAELHYDDVGRIATLYPYGR
jgi:Glycosyl hydrolases family 43